MGKGAPTQPAVVALATDAAAAAGSSDGGKGRDGETETPPSGLQEGAGGPAWASP